MQRIYTTLIISLLFFFSVNLEAKHIIGGEITYTYLGNDLYEFTMTIYRDCAGGGAGFDDPANIALYQGNAEPYTQIGNTESVFIEMEIPLDPDTGPCVEIPDNVCVEEGTYTFQFVLPLGLESYHIVYQRCCRNNTITNIESPEDSGVTYYIELTPEAQAVENNSPVFNSFPPIVICAGEPLMVDHSASDPDGIDQLVYELCSPLLGGGPEGGPNGTGGDPAGCDGLTPNPPCAPSFEPVQFLFPTYDALNPLGGDNPVTIDPVTGIITGIPETIGQFVVGICVSEYRNGELLSTVSRDFQFNVTSCEALVEVDMEATVIAGTQEFSILSCGDPTIGFINQSVQQQFIDDYFWEFDYNNGTLDTFYEWDPIVTFPDTGFFQGTLILNPNSQCSDTGYVSVRIYPDVVPDFSFEYDTCIAGPVDFTDLTTAGSTPIVEWNWDFGDGNYSTEQRPSHLFDDPGTKEVKLAVEDQNGCRDSLSQDITWFPVPPLIVLEPNTYVGCPPLPIVVTNLSTPIDTTYDIRWTFGEEDGDTIIAFSPEYIYEEPGTYTIGVEITSPIGCFTSEVFEDFIDVDSLPVANFTYRPSNPDEEISNFNNHVQFIDRSRRAVNWDWTFDEHGTTILQNPLYTFQDTGLQVIELIVTHPYGCVDTTSLEIDVVPKITYFMPNAFTPNGDGENEEFKGGGYFVGLNDYHIMIVDRFGGLMFESSNPDEGWNGRRNNSGRIAQNGIYVYKLRYTGPRGIPYEVSGFATLIR